MIITADLIRKFPFAVAPHRVTDELQILISRDIAEAVRAEGHRKILPPAMFSTPKKSDADGRLARHRAIVLKAMAKGDTLAGKIKWRTNLERESFDAVIAHMLEEGLIVGSVEKHKQLMLPVYRLTPAGKAESEQIIRAEQLAKSA